MIELYFMDCLNKTNSRKVIPCVNPSIKTPFDFFDNDNNT